MRAVWATAACCGALLAVSIVPAGALALPSVGVAAVTAPLTNTTAHTGVTVTAGCAASSTLVGGGSYLRNATDPATLPTNGLVLGGQAPSSGSSPVDGGLANGGTDPTHWFSDANFTGVADPANLDQAETFALCATGGPAHTVVASASTVGAANNANQQVSPPVPATATCPSGTELIGGGAVTSTPDQVNDGTTVGNSGNLKPLASYPSDAAGVAAADGSTGATSWSSFGAAGISNDGGGQDVVTAYALCSTDASPPPVEVVRVDVPGPAAQAGTTTITGSATCPGGTQLLGGGYRADETVGTAVGLEPQQGYHMRGSYPSSGPAASAGGTPPAELADGASDPATWTDLLQLGGQTLPAGDFGVLHVFAMCQTPAAAPASADLSVTLSGAPDPVIVGQAETYSLGVADAGPAAATGVVATVTLPAGVTFVSATASAGSCGQSAGTVTCTFGGLASGGSASATIVVTPTQAGPLTAAASVSGSETDPNATNDTASASTAADLPTRGATTLTAQPAAATLGSPIADHVTLGGGSAPTGTITFDVYGPGDSSCALALASSTATVTGNGTYDSEAFTPTTAGTYHWIAAYGGDGANAPTPAQACGDPSQAASVRVVPTLVAQAQGTAAAGDYIAGQATLSGATVATGTLTLSVYGPSDPTCTTPLASTTAVVSGNGIYGSHPFATTVAGVYRWVATYGGDAVNTPVGPTACSAPGSTIAVSPAATAKPPAGGPPATAATTFAATTPKVATTGKISLTVTSPGRGAFRATATVVVPVDGKKSRRVSYGTRSVAASRAGRLTLAIAPSAAGRALRAQHTRVTVTLVVTFTPTGGKPRTRTFHVRVRGTLRPPTKRTGKAT